MTSQLVMTAHLFILVNVAYFILMRHKHAKRRGPTNFMVLRVASGNNARGRELKFPPRKDENFALRVGGHEVLQSVEVEGRGFDSRWCHWNFSFT
jgi:hypothetical protein